MADNLTNYAESKLLNHLLGIEEFVMPENAYVALFTAAPDDTGGGTEVPGGGTAYARQELNPSKSENGGASSNNAQIEFPKALEDWGEITHIGIFDAAAGGNLEIYGPLSEPIDIETGDTFVLLKNTLSAALS